MQPPSLQGPGSYIRLIVAGSLGIGNRPIPMGEIGLNPEERRGVAEVVSYHWATNAEHLTVEQRIQWGALVLFVAANSPDPRVLKSPLDQPITAEQIELIRQGAEYLERLRVTGAPEAFRRLHAAIVAAGGPGSSVQRDGQASSAQSLPMLEAEPMRPVLGRHRIRVRVTSTGDDRADASTVTVTLVVPSRADIVLCIDDAPGGTITDEGVAFQIGEEWTEILFRLRGPAEEDVLLDVLLGSHADTAQTFTLDEPFLVTALPAEISGDRTPRT